MLSRSRLLANHSTSGSRAVKESHQALDRRHPRLEIRSADIFGIANKEASRCSEALERGPHLTRGGSEMACQREVVMSETRFDFSSDW